MIDSLAQRWGCAPSQVRRESAADVLQMMAILAEGTPQPDG